MDAADFIKKGVDLIELNLLPIRNEWISNYYSNLKSKGLSNIDTLLKNKSLVINKNKEGIFLIGGLTYIESLSKAWFG